MIIRDADGTIYREVTNPAALYDITTGQLICIGEYVDMERVYDKKREELMNKGRIQAANDLCVSKISSQENLDRIWQNNKVEVRH
jgi:hypothetical protein